MHLYYHVGEDGKRVYTLKKKDPEGKPTMSAHPGSFCLPSLPIPLIPGRNAWLPVAEGAVGGTHRRAACRAGQFLYAEVFMGPSTIAVVKGSRRRCRAHSQRIWKTDPCCPPQRVSLRTTSSRSSDTR